MIKYFLFGVLVTCVFFLFFIYFLFKILFSLVDEVDLLREYYLDIDDKVKNMLSKGYINADDICSYDKYLKEYRKSVLRGGDLDD